MVAAGTISVNLVVKYGVPPWSWISVWGWSDNRDGEACRLVVQFAEHYFSHPEYRQRNANQVADNAERGEGCGDSCL